MLAELSNNEIAIIVTMLAYIVLISIVINKFQQNLKAINKAKLSLHHNRIDLVQLKSIVSNELASIRNLKRKSTMLIFLIGFVHLFIYWIMDLNLLSVAIPFVLFLFILHGNFWLKGSTVSSSIRNIPGVSDYHAW